jgi:hypothetical protein
LTFKTFYEIHLSSDILAAETSPQSAAQDFQTFPFRAFKMQSVATVTAIDNIKFQLCTEFLDRRNKYAKPTRYSKKYFGFLKKKTPNLSLLLLVAGRKQKFF